jgi:hypothetical protein
MTSVAVAELNRELETDKPRYVYRQTVFVHGNCRAYLRDLESYFRDSVMNFADVVGYRMRDLKRLANAPRIAETYRMGEREIKQELLVGISAPLHSGVKFPMQLTLENVDEIERWFIEYAERQKDKLASQKINRQKIIDLLDKRIKPFTLDITNYEREHVVVRIQHVKDPRFGEAIRMRVFFDETSGREYDSDLPSSFARHARHFALANIETEHDVHETPVAVDDYIKSSGVVRSRLRVIEPGFEVVKSRRGYNYSLTLSKSDREMLSCLFDRGLDRRVRSHTPRIDGLCFASSTWTPYQATRIVRNLFGIIGILEDPGKVRGVRYNFHIPPRNLKRTVSASKTGVFQGTVRFDDLPVLKFVFDRTRELKEKYGWGFYPRFSVREVAKRTGISRDEVKTSLEHLTGALTMTRVECNDEKSRNKWFISKARLPLVWKILNMEGLVS